MQFWSPLDSFTPSIKSWVECATTTRFCTVLQEFEDPRHAKPMRQGGKAYDLSRGLFFRQARIASSTLPWTSVRRKSRPA